MKSFSSKIISLFLAITISFAPTVSVLAQANSGAAAGSTTGGSGPGAGAIGAAILDCTGLSGMIASAISSLFNLTEVAVTQSKETCLDSIGFALAKTLLASITDSTINWINNGFEGRPSFVGDFGGFFKEQIQSELQLGLQELKASGTIYFDLIRQKVIYDQRVKLGGKLFDLDKDIVKTLCTYENYQTETFCTEQLTPESRAELTNSYLEGQIAGREVGWNWDIWNSMTQNCGNNPFCAVTTELNELNQRGQERITNLNDELNRGSGFLGQKKCANPKNFDEQLEAYNDAISQNPANTDPLSPNYNPLQLSELPDRPVCAEYKILTPGGVIASKINLSLGTNDRQLELADEFNESIAAIFDALINKLIEKGLSSFNGDDEDGNDSYYTIDLENAGFDYPSTGSSIDQTRDGCEATGGVFDEELEVCDRSDDDQGSYPEFPWEMDDGTTINDGVELGEFVNNNPDVCIEINNFRVVDGEEPCITGTAETGGDDGETGDGEAVMTPSTAEANTEVQITITGGPANLNFDVLMDNNEDESLSTNLTDSNGSAVDTFTLPANYTSDSELQIVFDDGSSISVTK